MTAPDGVELVGYAWGSGPGLLMVHGFGGAKEDFFGHVQALSENFTVVTFDNRGHGESGMPTELTAYSLDIMRADTLAVADAVGLDQFVLLGHSMGGMITRRIAIDHPHRVQALIMMDSTPGPVPGFDPELIDLAVNVALEQGKDELKALLDMASPLSNDAYLRVTANDPQYVAFMDRKWDSLSISMWVTMAQALARQPDDLDAMRSLTIPVLVIVGELDAPLRISADEMLSGIASATLAVIENAGHSPQFENADGWYAAMQGFLSAM